MAPKPWTQAVAVHMMLALLLVASAPLGSSAASQDPPQASTRSYLYGQLLPHCPTGDGQGSIASGMRCPIILSEAAYGQVEAKYKQFLSPCCQDMNDLSKSGFSEECACNFVQLADKMNVPIDKACDLTNLREDCREAELRKLGPCDRMLQRLAARETSKVSAEDVTACDEEIKTCKACQNKQL